MPTYTDNPDPQRGRHRHPVRHPRRRQGQQRHRQVPVPRQQQVDQRNPQPLDDPRLLRRRAGDGAHRGAHLRRRSPRRAGRCRQRPDAGRVRAARARRLPDRRHRQHRRRPQRQPDRGRVDRRGRHRPARHPRTRRGEVRNGFQGIKVSFKLKGDDPEKLRKVVEQSQARSAVYDIVTNGVPVAIEVEAG